MDAHEPPRIRIDGMEFTANFGDGPFALAVPEGYTAWISGTFECCPVCRHYWHAEDCPLRGLMALSWTGRSPDERARDAHG